jgi:hypothetical protein
MHQSLEVHILYTQWLNLTLNSQRTQPNFWHDQHEWKWKQRSQSKQQYSNNTVCTKNGKQFVLNFGCMSQKLLDGDRFRTLGRQQVWPCLLNVSRMRPYQQQVSSELVTWSLTWCLFQIQIELCLCRTTDASPRWNARQQYISPMFLVSLAKKDLFERVCVVSAEYKVNHRNVNQFLNHFEYVCSFYSIYLR